MIRRRPNQRAKNPEHAGPYHHGLKAAARYVHEPNPYRIGTTSHALYNRGVADVLIYLVYDPPAGDPLWIPRTTPPP